MGVQQDFYSTDGQNKTFPSTKHIATKQHMAVWLRQKLDTVEVQLDPSKYELITNAAVLNSSPSTILYDRIEIRVADSLDELTSSPSAISVVAGIAEEVVTVAGIESEVVTVADDTVALNLVADDLAKGIGTNQPTDSAILNALTNATQTQADVVLAAASANEAAASAASVNNPAQTITELLSFDTSVGYVNVLGYHTANDGGGGIFNYDSTIDKSTANGGTIIDPSVSLALQGTGVGFGCWVRQYSGAVNVKWFGAVEGEDSTVAIQATIDSGFRHIFIPEGTFNISDTLNLTTDCLHFQGAGRGSGGGSVASLYKKAPTILNWIGTGTKSMLNIGPGDASIAWGGTIEGFALHGNLIAGVSGIVSEIYTANKVYRDIEIVGTVNGLTLGDGAYACRLYNVGCYEYTGIGFIGVAGNHNAVFNGCQINYCVPYAGYAGATLGVDLNTGTGISFIGCDFEPGYAQTFVFIRGCDGITFQGCYLESRSALTTALIRLGDGIDPVYGVTINGCTLQGKTFTREAFYLNNANGVSITGNHIFGFTDYVVNNAVLGTGNTFDGNWVSSTPAIFKSIAAGGNAGRGFYKESRTRLGTAVTAITTSANILDHTHYSRRTSADREVSANIIFTLEDPTATNASVTAQLQKFDGVAWNNFGNSVLGKIFINTGTRVIVEGTLILSEVDSALETSASYRVVITAGAGDTIDIDGASQIKIIETEYDYK